MEAGGGIERGSFTVPSLTHSVSFQGLSLFYIKTTPVAKTFSSELDVMPPIEAGWQKIIARIRPPG